MPNNRNIESPITLIAFGRSGTSLVSSIFRHHPNCHSVNETINLIFGTWHAAELSVGHTPPLIEKGTRLTDEERAGRVVRQTFLTCFANQQQYWFQKPIAFPQIFPLKFVGKDERSWSEIAEWYWTVMTHSFPQAKYFTILRHPCDVVLSAQSYWKSDAASVWLQLGLMAYVLTHPLSPVEYAIHFEELVQNKEVVVKQLFEYLDIPFSEKVLEAFNQVHVASKGREQPDSKLVTRRNEWDKLDPHQAKPFYREQIANLFDKFGYSLEWPQHFFLDNQESNAQPQQAENPEETIHRLRQKIDTLLFESAAKQQKIEHQRARWQRLAEEREVQRRYWQHLAQEKQPITLSEQNLSEIKKNRLMNQQSSASESPEERLQELENTLQAIYGSQMWRLTFKYWTIKEKTIASATAIYRTILPDQLRIALRRFRQSRHKAG